MGKLKVKSYERKRKTGEKVKVHYYPVAEVRKAFQKELQKKGYTYSIAIYPKDCGNSIFLMGDLKVYEKEKKEIITELSVSYLLNGIVTGKEVPSYSTSVNETAVLITRIEKRLMVMYLGLEDPEEAIGEEKHAEEIARIKEGRKSEPITEAQKKAIDKMIVSNLTLSPIVQEFLKKLGKAKVEELTKEEAGKLIKELQKDEREG